MVASFFCFLFFVFCFACLLAYVRYVYVCATSTASSDILRIRDGRRTDGRVGKKGKTIDSLHPPTN